MSWNLARRKTPDYCHQQAVPSAASSTMRLYSNCRCFVAQSRAYGGICALTRPAVSHTSRAIAIPTSASTRYLSSPSVARFKKRALDIDTIVSVLELSATKRDAKGYLQKYARQPKPKPTADKTQAPHEPERREDTSHQRATHVAIVKLRCPQYLDDEMMTGIAKTLTQLKVLGLLSIIVLDCGIDESRAMHDEQALRLCEALDSFSKPGCRFLGDVAVGRQTSATSAPSVFGSQMCVDDEDRLSHTIQRGLIPVIPSLARRDETSSLEPTNADQLVLTLTKYLIGLQFASSGVEQVASYSGEIKKSRKLASVERIIVLDPLGGTPMSGRPGASHRFVNLEQEYDTLQLQLMGPEGSPLARKKDREKAWSTVHVSNLRLAKEALSILPSSSSVLVTTPFAAVSTKMTSSAGTPALAAEKWAPQFGLDGMVTTRKRQNPLLHNLLTDKPVYSSSLPFQRINDSSYRADATGPSSAATLFKRGMPLTIFPNPRDRPWAPPLPGGSRLRLTDRCIDLPRLCYLIEDSFNRKLDVQAYLDRVNENLAGIIIAGEYEGGAILTWERPDGLDEKTAYEQGRLVPYLDKFAVLKSRQGGGGVADIVFNAMVNDCFPDGVCWRSRKDNPVNKWYFERSMGTSKIRDSNWTMFWTTTGLDTEDQTIRDYESVCRGVQPTWLHNNHVPD